MLDLMVCMGCGDSEGVIEVRHTAGGRRHIVHLCEVCARERGIHPEPCHEPDLNELYSALLSGRAVDRRIREVDECGRCGTTSAEVRRSRQVGCPECYSSFAPSIARLIGRSAKLTQHQGRLPRSLQTFRTLLVDRENLKNELRSAVAEEDFETAARIRDRLARLDRAASEAEI